MAATKLWIDHPTVDWHIYNRGVSGDKVFQLSDRWEVDCLTLQPDILSIHIGVNDFWHALTSGYKGTIETYEKDFLSLLERSQLKLPTVKFIIGEPFVVLGELPLIPRHGYPLLEAIKKWLQTSLGKWVQPLFLISKSSMLRLRPKE